MCLIVSGSEVGLHVESAPLPALFQIPESPDRTFAAVSSISRDGGLMQHEKVLASRFRVPDAALRPGDFVVDIRQVDPAEIESARDASRKGALPLLQPSGSSITPDARHPLLGSVSFPSFAVLVNAAVSSGRPESWPVAVQYDRFRLMTSSQVIRAIRSASNPIFGLDPSVCSAAPAFTSSSFAGLSVAASCLPDSSHGCSSYAAALGVSGFVGSVIMIVALRHAPENTFEGCKWRPPPPSVSSFLSSSSPPPYSAPSLFSRAYSSTGREQGRAQQREIASSPRLSGLEDPSPDLLGVSTVPKKPTAAIVISDSDDDRAAHSTDVGRLSAVPVGASQAISGVSAASASVSLVAMSASGKASAVSAVASAAIPTHGVKRAAMPLTDPRQRSDSRSRLSSKVESLTGDSHQSGAADEPSSDLSARSEANPEVLVGHRTLRPRGPRRGFRVLSEHSSSDEEGSALEAVQRLPVSKPPQPSAVRRQARPKAGQRIQRLPSPCDDDDVVQILAVAGRGAVDSSECAICLTELLPQAGGQARWKLMPCEHDNFCGHCVGALQGEANSRPAMLGQKCVFTKPCPLCRQTISSACPKSL